MEENTKIIVAVLVFGLALGLVIGTKIGTKPYFGGIVHNVQETFDEGIAVDGREVLDEDGGQFNLGKSTNAGCIVVGDTDAAGITYITVLDGVVSATSVKPSSCD